MMEESKLKEIKLETGKDYKVMTKEGRLFLGKFEEMLLNDLLSFKVGRRRFFFKLDEIEDIQELKVNSNAVDKESRKDQILLARREHRREYLRRYRKLNKEKNREWMKRSILKYRQLHPERVKESLERYWLRRTLEMMEMRTADGSVR
jgi:hypothetical protein